MDTRTSSPSENFDIAIRLIWKRKNGKPILTAHCKFSIFLMKVTKKLETQFQSGIERPVQAVHKNLDISIIWYVCRIRIISDIIAYHCTRFRQNPFFRIHLIYRHPVVAFCCHLMVAVLDSDLTYKKPMDKRNELNNCTDPNWSGISVCSLVGPVHGL